MKPMEEVLLSRFKLEAKKLFYPFLIATVLTQNKTATRQQIAAAIGKQTGDKFTINDASFTYLIGRMEKTFGLIEPLDDNRDLYQLTEAGKSLYSKSFKEVIGPLQAMLPKD